MWTSTLTDLSRREIKVQLSGGRGPLTVRAFLAALGDDPTFREHFTSVLRSLRFKAYFWELPPVESATVEHSFECVVVDAPAHTHTMADPSAFAERFATAPERGVHCFPNLGGDAWLVVPSRIAPHDCYGHLAVFLRNAPPSQIDAFWQTAAEAFRDRIGDTPLWLSTAGLGVPWLHLRIDSRPKYYRHEAYKQRRLA